GPHGTTASLTAKVSFPALMHDPCAATDLFCFQTGPVTLELNIPSDNTTSPFIRVTAGHYTGPSDDQRVTLQVLGQSLKGVFTVEQLTTKNGTKVVRLGFTNVDLFLGDAATNEGLQLTGGFGSFLLTPQGAAGEFGGSVTLTPTLQTRLNGS